MANETPLHLLLNQAVQIELPDQTTRHCAVVTNFLTNQIVVRFPQYSRMPEGLQAGLPISLRRVDISGLRVGKSRVADLCAPPRPGAVLDLPPLFETIQKRRFFRVEVDFPCQFQELRSDGAAGRKDFQARLLDISAGGARVATTCPLKSGDRMQLEFVPQIGPSPSKPRDANPGPAAVVSKTLPPRSPVRPTPVVGTPPPVVVAVPSIRVTAKVIRVVPAPNGPPETLHAGVEFEKLSSSTEDRLVTLVFDLQRVQCHSRPGG